MTNDELLMSLRSAILNNKIERIRQSASVNRQSISFSETLPGQSFFFDQTGRFSGQRRG
jgi:hypothetical protein